MVCSIYEIHLRMLTHTQLDRLVGLAMLIIATTVFAYYTVWALLMVWNIYIDSYTSTKQNTAIRR